MPIRGTFLIPVAVSPVRIFKEPIVQLFLSSTELEKELVLVLGGQLEK